MPTGSILCLILYIDVWFRLLMPFFLPSCRDRLDAIRCIWWKFSSGFLDSIINLYEYRIHFLRNQSLRQSYHRRLCFLWWSPLLILAILIFCNYYWYPMWRIIPLWQMNLTDCYWTSDKMGERLFYLPIQMDRWLYCISSRYFLPTPIVFVDFLETVHSTIPRMMTRSPTRTT